MNRQPFVTWSLLNEGVPTGVAQTSSLLCRRFSAVGTDERRAAPNHSKPSERAERLECVRLAAAVERSESGSKLAALQTVRAKRPRIVEEA